MSPWQRDYVARVQPWLRCPAINTISSCLSVLETPIYRTVSDPLCVAVTESCYLCPLFGLCFPFFGFCFSYVMGEVEKWCSAVSLGVQTFIQALGRQRQADLSSPGRHLCSTESSPTVPRNNRTSN